jgi:hypothetical protein
VLTGGDREHAETCRLCLHPLQSALVHVTTLLQQVPENQARAGRLTPKDRRALNPLSWTRINPCGRFDLDMDKRLNLAV